MTKQRTEAHKPAALKDARDGHFYSDLGSCGARSNRWAEAHDPTPATAAEATCISIDGTEYFATGYTYERTTDSSKTREFLSYDNSQRAFLSNDGRIDLD